MAAVGPVGGVSPGCLPDLISPGDGDTGRLDWLGEQDRSLLINAG